MRGWFISPVRALNFGKAERKLAVRFSYSSRRISGSMAEKYFTLARVKWLTRPFCLSFSRMS